jgi:hypothetical protein
LREQNRFAINCFRNRRILDWDLILVSLCS